MTELYRHIGQFTDVPAGDIGVGAREIGYLFGQYKRITNQFSGVLTGKGLEWGGSAIRPEATGYGAVYFAQEMLATRGDSLEGKTCLVSGSGNVAQYTVEKLIELGARPVTLSDSGGFVHDPDGIDGEKLDWVMELKNVRRGRIREYAEQFPGARSSRPSPGDANPLWSIPADCAFPSATQNEINGKDAANLISRRRHGGHRRCQHADHPRRRRTVHRLGRALRSRQGRQRRRSGRLGPGDGPGLRAPAVVPRAGRRAPAARSCGRSTPG